MRRTLFIVMLLTLPGVSLSAQQNSVIKLPVRNTTVGEAFRQIENQTGLSVAFSMDRLDVNKNIQLPGLEMSVEQILDRALTDTGLSYRIIGDDILIIPPRNAAPVVAETPIIAPPVQPQPDFERSLSEYQNPPLRLQSQSQALRVRYDTIVHELPHNGIFEYGQVNRNARFTARKAEQTSVDSRPPVIAIKANLLYAGATFTPNLGVEIGLGKRTSLDITGSYNPWNLNGSADDNKKLVHWIARPEFRYWLCERFNGHYFGINAFYWQYNVGSYDVPMLFDKEYRYEGNAIGTGLSYGYHWMWSKRWGMEFNIGAGVAFMNYDKMDCEKCGDVVGEFKKTYVGPTSVGIKLIFMIK